jgi:D-glycero-D-manno-heptose 1,7-bisphosphate phosphatase
MFGRPAVFVDRDGCLAEEVGDVNHPSRIRLLPRTAEAVRKLNATGSAAVIVTNRAGIARSYFSQAVLRAVNAEMVRQFEAEGARLDGLHVCPHHPRDGEPPYRAACDRRKPQPGLLRGAARDFGPDRVPQDLLGAVDRALAARLR